MRLIASPAIYLAYMLTSGEALAQVFQCEDLHSLSASQLLSSIELTAKIPQFQHGAGCFSAGAFGNQGCDWETSIAQDRKIGGNRRLIIATSNHLTGSGAWDHVVVYACAGDKIRGVLADKFLYGVHLESFSDQQLVLKSGHWEPHDPTCCPSAVSHITYSWNQETLAYTRAEQHKPRMQKQ